MRSNHSKRILVVAAHPDDEVLGCGASIAKHKSRGDTVWVLILGEGITSRRNLSENQKIKALASLKRDAESAHKILKTDRLIFKNFPDNSFDCVPLLEIIHKVEEAAEKFKPDVIYTHHGGDVNVDHRRVTEAVEAAVRPYRSTVKEVLAFEIPSSSECNFSKRPAFRPNVFCEIDQGALDKKIRALKEYRSEIRKFPHPRSQEYLRALSVVRGGQSGFHLAEAFELIYLRN